MAETFVPKYLWVPEGKSPHDRLKEEPSKAKRFLESLTDEQARQLKYQWDYWARPKQKAPPSNVVPHQLGWKFWVYLAGRGTGKTRLAAEWVRGEIMAGRAKRIVLAAPTYVDVYKTMIEGESGLMNVFDPKGSIELKMGKSSLRFIDRRLGVQIAEARIMTGEKPEKFRGGQYDLSWFDELAAFKYLSQCWDLWLPSLRLGKNPRAIFTTTPKASLTKVNLLTADRTVVTFARSEENKDNLAPGFYDELVDLYQDTDFAAQELEGVLYLGNTGAPFKTSWLNDYRVDGELVKNGGSWAVKSKNGPSIDLSKIIVAIDPSGSAKKSACECGIIVAGLGADGITYILKDLSKRCTSDEWGDIAAEACQTYGATLVFESNYGGGMAGTICKKAAQNKGFTVKVKDVSAQKDKTQRAMMVSPLVQKGKVRLVGKYPKLEEQMVLWEPGLSKESPDRMDAMVWAVLDLTMGQSARGVFGGNFAF